MIERFLPVCVGGQLVAKKLFVTLANLDNFRPPQQNLWPDSGPGCRPSVWYSGFSIAS